MLDGMQTWATMKPPLKRALAARAMGTQDSRAIDRLVASADLAARARTTSGLALAPRARSTGDTGEIRVDPDGYVHGIDGMLDQLSGSLARQIRTEILPDVLRDRDALAAFGEGCGRGAARQLGWWVKVATFLSAVAAAVTLWDHASVARR